ncbi:MAG: hypothetical protein JOZ62_08125, partial [Acidobacteriaceae bacterium]|nr:hypothetical protein [Acidobacteriaceae bacterium]
MKAQGRLFTAATLYLGLTAAFAAQQAAPDAPDRLTVNIDTQQTAAPVSKYLYGGFIEHIGTLIYRSLWSEMVDDRKFYFPISSKDTELPASASARPARMPLRKWRPVGPDGAVVMDKNHPFVGDQSPRIELDGTTPHGIQQSGLMLLKGKQYTGRVY